MLTKDEFLQLAREAGIEVHERKQQARIGSAIFTGGDSSDQLMRFAELIEARAQASTLATVTPLVQELCSSLENLLAEVRGECPALLDEDRGGSAYLGMDADDSIADARAFLSGATKESTDHGTHKN